ncbi:hypothetical protein TNCV_4983001 [Trichonephila clavipes]|uniref:Uncharacterized protein n=1 Tax=Trichonephila clavipes TaxID=2585209 RepID=A0A8X7BKV5_TRICX|nr:hypothetical protein TNCV_4983001 [Trichonephila clavipes]
MKALDDLRLQGAWKMLCWCLNVFEKIVTKYLSKSLRLHTGRHRLKVSIHRKRPQLRQGSRFVSSDEVKVTSLEALREVAKNGFQKLYKRWQKCIVTQGDYFEGGCTSVL